MRQIPQVDQTEFLLQLMHALQENAYNFYIDNYDIDRPRDRKKWRQRMFLLVQKALMVLVRNPKLVFLSSPYRPDLDALTAYSPHLRDVARLYSSLADDQSRNLLVTLFAYKILGKERVRLPLSNKEYTRTRKSLRRLEQKDRIFMESMRMFLLLHDLNPLGYDLKIYAPRGGTHVSYVSKQYEYLNSTPPFTVQAGEVVVDAGAGFGDTSFRFASESGETGKVYSFEFVPANLEVIRHTMQLNPVVGSRIEIVERPVWSSSNVSVNWKDGGASTRIVENADENKQFSAKTISIDDWAEEGEIEAVHFIKMDIEGAELEALKGAVKTLKRFKPKLAIALYHKLEDFWTIPDFLQSLGLGYRFYLGHYTIFEYETVLYAIA